MTQLRAFRNELRLAVIYGNLPGSDKTERARGGAAPRCGEEQIYGPPWPRRASCAHQAPAMIRGAADLTLRAGLEASGGTELARPLRPRSALLTQQIYKRRADRVSPPSSRR